MSMDAMAALSAQAAARAGGSSSSNGAFDKGSINSAFAAGYFCLFCGKDGNTFTKGQKAFGGLKCGSCSSYTSTTASDASKPPLVCMLCSTALPPKHPYFKRTADANEESDSRPRMDYFHADRNACEPSLAKEDNKELCAGLDCIAEPFYDLSGDGVASLLFCKECFLKQRVLLLQSGYDHGLLVKAQREADRATLYQSPQKRARES